MTVKTWKAVKPHTHSHTHREKQRDRDRYREREKKWAMRESVGGYFPYHSVFSCWTGLVDRFRGQSVPPMAPLCRREVVQDCGVTGWLPLLIQGLCVTSDWVADRPGHPDRTLGLWIRFPICSALFGPFTVGLWLKCVMAELMYGLRSDFAMLCHVILSNHHGK